MTTLFDFVLLVLATWQALEIWHHGEIFRTWREAARFCRIENLSYLSQCMFCLSPWVALVLLCLSYWTAGWFVVTVLAVSRAANALNDLTHRYCRTPHDDEDTNASTTEVFTGVK